MRIACYGDSLTEGVPGVAYVDLLREALPEHTILNRGKGGATVRSLYNRLAGQKSLDSVDLAFVWIGVNDAFVHVAWHYPFIKKLLGEYWAVSPKGFARDYGLLLDLLLPYSQNIVTVSPLLVGENMGNRWNRQLDGYCRLIQTLSAEYEHVDYCDLRSKAAALLTSAPVSRYVAKCTTRIMLDVLLLRQPEQVDRKAAERGLMLTLDGVHLNSRGAALAVEIFSDIIHRHEAWEVT
jgi:lysophospholipase L1-like esterase